MINEKTIISHKDLSVKLSGEPGEDILDLLNNTVLGTSGGLRYSLTIIDERIKSYKDNIRFATLYKGKRLIGTIGLCYRKINTAGKSYHSSYLRYLAFIPVFQSALSTGANNGKRVKDNNRESWKERVFSFLREPFILDFPGCSKDDKHIVYAYIEGNNERSKNLIRQVGFEKIRSFITLSFSRLKPRELLKAEILREEDESEMVRLLQHFYQDHSFYDDTISESDNKYYIYRDGEEIIAGVGIIHNSLKIEDIPGLKGWLFMNVLSRLPLLKRIFQPGEMKFLVLESIYFRKGREKDLEKLIETVLSVENQHVALSWMDTDSEACLNISSNLRMGILNRLLNSSPGYVYAGFVNLSMEEKEEFYSRPAFIKGVDFM